MPTEPSDDDAVLTVDLGDAENVAYWCARWQVDVEELRQAVDHAGAADAPAVAFALGREAV